MEPLTSIEQGCSSKPHCGRKLTGLPKWNPKYKIFLSHSGKQKEFVRQLCKDLEAKNHQPFFDERSSSLMMGERFAPLIFEAARQCLVAVIVLSEDFLTSKWPMLELVEFMKAKKSHNPHLKLLPLFYKLSLEDLKVESIASQWEATWTELITPTLDQGMPLDDTHRQLNLSLCKEALCELRGTKGLKFENFPSKVAYREAIVKEISMLVAPNLLDDTSDVIGNERLCKVIGGMFVEDTIEDSNLQGTFKLGLYGMGGLGKTTLCRALCMFFHKQFNGQVFHVELGSRPLLDLQKLVLLKLLRINKDLVEQVHTVHEGRELLKDHMNRQPVFLAIDNITDDPNSQLQALSFLEAGFHPRSMIMITSRSLDVIEDLFPSHPNAMYCKAVTKLSADEARLIFLRRAAPQRKFETLTIGEGEILDECLSQCHFLFDNQERQYHPLALQALADYYHKFDNLNILKWKGHLEDLDKFRLSNASSNIFGVLGLQFMTLTLKEKLIFLDLCLYIDQSLLSMYSKKVLRWLVDIYEDTPTTMKFQLQSLKRLGIINITFNEDGDQFITIHDLYKEFAKWYVIDGEGACCPKLGCVYHTMSTYSLPYVLKRTSPSSSQLQRIHLQNLKCASFPSKKVGEWCNVVVLEIYECSNLKVLEQLHGLSCLCHLELGWLPQLESFEFGEWQADNRKGFNGMLESLQHVVLIGLTSLKQLPDFSLCTMLKTFQMLKCEEFLLKPPRFMGCSQLEDLELSWNWQWQVEDFKLNTLTSLTSLQVWDPKYVGAPNWPTISTLKVVSFPTVSRLGNCSKLQKLHQHALPIINHSDLEKLLRPDFVVHSACETLRSIPERSSLLELSRMYMNMGLCQQLPGVERLLQLRRLELTSCYKLTLLPNLGGLPELTYMQLVGCKSLKGQPQLPMDCRLDSFDGAFD